MEGMAAARVGRIIFMNKTLKKALKRDNEDLRFLRVNEIMPKLVDEKHDGFLKRFSQTGESLILNQQLLLFARDKD